MLNRVHSQSLQYFKDNAPEWMTDEALSTLMKGYLLPDESPNNMYERIAKAAASRSIPELASEFEYILKKGWFSPATPVAANLGTKDSALPVSCFSIQVQNSIANIFESVKEAALLTKYGGGLGIELSNIKGPTSAADWGKFFDNIGSIVSQAGVRRGAVSLYLDFDHPDLADLLRAKDAIQGDPREKIDCNIAVKIKDSDIALIKSGDKRAVELFSKILESRMKTGSPYLQFIDNCHRQDPISYKINNLSSGASNLCLLGSELVVTKEGPQRIKDLVNKEVEIFDGKNWVLNNRFRQIGTSSKFIEIILKSGAKLITTPEHKIFLENGKTTKQAKELKIGDKLWRNSNLESHGNTKLLGAYAKGFMVGDGCYAYLAVYKPKYICMAKLERSILELPLREKDIRGRAWPQKTKVGEWSEPQLARSGFTGLQTSEKVFFQGVKRFEGLLESSSWKAGLPDEWITWDRESKCEFLAGLFDADACGRLLSNTYGHVSFASKSVKLREDIQAMLSTLGIKSLLYRKRVDLHINGWDGARLLNMLPVQRLPHLDILGKRKREHEIYLEKVISVKEIEYEEAQPVYCTTVETTGGFALVNRTITGNCNEITLFHDADHTYSCVLSSLNVEKWGEWRHWRSPHGWSVPALGIIFLDGVCQEFIDRAGSGLEKARRSAIKGRPLGLGVLGLHGLYQRRGLAWSSNEAFELNKLLFKFIREEADKATRYLAKELGEPEWCKGLGIRNTHLMACAPTTTNSVICGASSPGIEPTMANYFAVEGAKGTFTRQNKYLKEILQKYNKDNGHIWASIREYQGSVQHLDFLTEAEKNVFKTAIEIDQFDILKQAADRQVFIDQGQSLNLFIRHDENADKIVKLHMLAHELNLKGLYYVRSTSAMANKNNLIDFVYLKTRPECIYCKMAKDLLDSKNIKYQEVYKPTGQVPEIYIDGEKLENGYTSLLKKFQVDDIDFNKCQSCEG